MSTILHNDKGETATITCTDIGIRVVVKRSGQTVNDRILYTFSDEPQRVGGRTTGGPLAPALALKSIEQQMVAAAAWSRDLPALPDHISSTHIPGQHGLLYEFDVDASAGAVNDALKSAAGVSVYDGRNTQVQSWDRAAILAAHRAVKAAGLSFV